MPGLNYQLTLPPTVEPISLALAKKQVRIDISDDDYLLETYIAVAREWCEMYTNRAFYPQTWQLWLDSFPYGDYRSTVPIDQRSPWNYSAYWNDFAIRLPKPKCQQVLSLTYVDSDLAQQTLAADDYFVDLNSEPCRITPPAGGIWPMTQFYQPGSISVTFIAASYQYTITDENVALTAAPGQSAPVFGVLHNQLLSITSVSDTNGNPLTYTMQPVLDDNGDPTDKTQITISAAPTGNVAVVTYNAGIIPPSIKAAMLLIIGHLYEHREENTEVSLRTLPMGVTQFLVRYVFNNFGNYRSGF